jgi:3-hydroxyisobutyrate dehydrogenase
MAANLLKAGHDLIVFDSAPGRAAQFAAGVGGRAAGSLADLAGAEFVVSMLPTGKDVRGVYLDAGLASQLTAGTIAIDMTSAEPSGTRELGAALAKQGILLVDAPVSGALPRATEGTLAIMIGGDDRDAVERAKPLLAAMGNRLFDTGGLGTGHAMKALNNYCAAASYVSSMEALLAGKRFGLDPARMVEILNVSTGRSFNTEVVLLEQVIQAKHASGFQLGLLAKDVKIAADLMRDVQLDAPFAALVAMRYAAARDELGYTRDNTEAYKAWDKDG